MNDPLFIFIFGLVVSAIIGVPLCYAIVVKNRINRRQEREDSGASSDAKRRPA